MAGIDIPQPKVQRLPVILPRPHPHQPIRAIDADAFADLHLAHLTSDVPDSVLFPFLHGLEGDNAQQNAFFAASSGLDLPTRREDAPPNSRSSSSTGRRSVPPNVVKVPEYRGLVWVACDDADAPNDNVPADNREASSHMEDVHLDEDEDDDDDFDLDYDESDERESEEDLDEVEEHTDLMQVDESETQVDVVSADEDASALAGPDSSFDASSPDDAMHMHPQTFRKLKPNGTAPIAIQTGSHHSSFFSPASAHISNTHTHNNAHGAHQNHTIRFPSSDSSPASLDPHTSMSETDSPHDRRLSTSSITTSESSSSVSTSASESNHSHYGFGSTSGSYSTTASSVGQLKDLDPDSESNSDADTTSPTIDSPVDTESTAPTTPNTSPVADIKIDDCIPSLNATRGPVHTASDQSVATTKTSGVSRTSSTSGAEKSKGLDGDFSEAQAKQLRIASSFCAKDLLTTDPVDGGSVFISPKVPDGISLRNFGIQVVSPNFISTSSLPTVSVIRSKKGEK
jgi:hypothetical protein